MKTVVKNNVQVGWEFVGANIVSSTGYSKEIFFPAGVETNSMEYRASYYSADMVETGDKMTQVKGTVGSRWNYERNQELPPKFEVVIIERSGDGKIKTTIAQAKPLIVEAVEIEIEVEDDEVAQDE